MWTSAIYIALLAFVPGLEWQSPWLLLLLLGLPWLWRAGRKNQLSALQLPTAAGLAPPESWRIKFTRWLPILRFLAIALTIIALARPRSPQALNEQVYSGVDIMLVLDVSGSMSDADQAFPPTRLTVARSIANDFITARDFDRIGLVFFADQAVTVCPLTADHELLTALLLQSDTLSLGSGTAIGMGLATGVNRLEDSEAKSKVIVLLTDGTNNAGFIQPLAAGELARTLDIKTYLIGIGPQGKQASLDEQELRQIAKQTSGAYFRATNTSALSEIFEQIDRLEKTDFDAESMRTYTEWFWVPALLALVLILLEVGLRWTWLRSLP